MEEKSRKVTQSKERDAHENQSVNPGIDLISPSFSVEVNGRGA